jgi:hypothetical protein
MLKSAGLYAIDKVSGKEGLTLAAILLFGTEEAIDNELLKNYNQPHIGTQTSRYRIYCFDEPQKVSSSKRFYRSASKIQSVSPYLLKKLTF